MRIDFKKMFRKVLKFFNRTTDKEYPDEDRWDRLKKNMAEGYLSKSEERDINNLKKEFNEMKEQLSSNPLEDEFNNKHPKKDIVYNGRHIPEVSERVPIDVRNFFNPYDSEVKKIVKSLKLDGQTDDTKAVKCLSWVIDNIEYVSDKRNVGLPEYWQFAFETLYLGKGDCLRWDTKLLTPFGLKNIENIMEGEYIIGKNGKYNKVNKKWDKGFLPTKKYILNNGTEIISTDDHRFILNNGEEKLAKDIKIGDYLKQVDNINLNLPDEIANNKEKVDKDYWYLVGLYVSDGWCDESKKTVCISGKDNHPKEEQKKWVQEYCEKNKLSYYWHDRYISIKSKGLFYDLRENGKGAKDKHIQEIPHNKENIYSLIEGLKADAHINKNESITFGTISEKLKNQIRILYRAIGKSVHTRLWQPTETQHGKNPIWRITVRNKREVPVKIVGIIEDAEERVYDIEVEENEIYLPENDCVVHNCEDGSILLGNMMLQAGIPYWKIRPTAGWVKTGNGKGGHAYMTYYSEKYDKWVTLDWCYYPNKKKIKDREHYKDNPIYLNVWFSWNKKYSFSDSVTEFNPSINNNEE